MDNFGKTTFMFTKNILKCTSLWPIKNKYITKFIQWFIISYLILNGPGIMVILNHNFKFCCPGKNLYMVPFMVHIWIHKSIFDAVCHLCHINKHIYHKNVT